MRAALIPPISALSTYGQGDFHLLLSHLLPQPEYIAHYTMQRHRGAYIVLDNSAHEHGEGENAVSLLKHAVRLNAQELVVPDVLFNGESTIENAVSSHEAWFEGNSKAFLDLNPALMYVPQGKDEAEYYECLACLISIHLHAVRKYDVRRKFVIGVSKDYEDWDGGLMKVLSGVKHAISACETKHHITPEVHLLGWGRRLWALRDLAKHYPWIRSVDSAKPFVYALKGIVLDPNKPPPPYPKRPKGYFVHNMTPKEHRVATANVVTFRASAR